MVATKEIQEAARVEMAKRGYLKDLQSTALVRFAVFEAHFKNKGITEIWLFGSYLKGYFSDGANPVPPAIAQLRKAMNRPEVSDIDLMADVTEKIEIDGGAYKYKYKIQIFPISGNEEKLLIWKNGKFVN